MPRENGMDNKLLNALAKFVSYFAKNMLTFYFFFINPLTVSAPNHIETSKLICRANQLTGFYMMGNISC